MGTLQSVYKYHTSNGRTADPNSSNPPQTSTYDTTIVQPLFCRRQVTRLTVRFASDSPVVCRRRCLYSSSSIIVGYVESTGRAREVQVLAIPETGNAVSCVAPGRASTISSEQQWQQLSSAKRGKTLQARSCRARVAKGRV